MFDTHDIPTAESLMNRDVYCLAPEMMLTEATRSLRKHNVSCAPVVTADETGRKILVGFVSEGDCLDKLSNEMFYGFPQPPQTVATFMKKHPLCVGPDTDVFALASVFISHRMRHLPVVDTDNHLLGLVSRREILKALDRFHDLTDRDYQREHFRPDLHQIANLRFVGG